jgi:hypothetical protein
MDASARRSNAPSLPRLASALERGWLSTSSWLPEQRFAVVVNLEFFAPCREALRWPADRLKVLDEF